MKKITQILLAVILFCGCGVKDVDFEYSDKDPESINYDPEQPQIIAAAFENHYPVLTIKPGSILAEGTVIEKSLTAEADFFAIDTIAVDIYSYADTSGIYSKWLQYRVSTVKKKTGIEFHESQIRSINPGNIQFTSLDSKFGNDITWSSGLSVNFKVYINYRRMDESEWSEPVFIEGRINSYKPVDVTDVISSIYRVTAYTEKDGIRYILDSDERVYHHYGLTKSEFEFFSLREVILTLFPNGDVQDEHILYVKENDDYVEIGRAAISESLISGKYAFTDGRNYTFKIVTAHRGAEGHELLKVGMPFTLTPPVFSGVKQIDENIIEVKVSMSYKYTGDITLTVSDMEGNVLDSLSFTINNNNAIYRISGLSKEKIYDLVAGNEQIGYSAPRRVGYLPGFKYVDSIQINPGSRWLNLSGDKSKLAFVYRDFMYFYDASSLELIDMHGLGSDQLGIATGIDSRNLHSIYNLNFDGSKLIYVHNQKIHRINFTDWDIKEFTVPLPDPGSSILYPGFIGKNSNHYHYTNGQYFIVTDLDDEIVYQQMKTNGSDIIPAVDYHYEHMALNINNSVDIFRVGQDSLIKQQSLSIFGHNLWFSAFFDDTGSLIERLHLRYNEVDYRDPNFPSVNNNIYEGYILNEQFFVNISASIDIESRYGNHRTVKKYPLPADFEIIREMIYDPAEQLLYTLIAGKHASTHKIFKMKLHTEWSFYGENPFPLK